jgi:hypothetical protein
MVTQLDLDKVVKSASLKTQSDQTLAMDVPAIKADVKSKLSKMRSVLGPTAQSRLFELKRGVLVSAAAPGSSCTLTLKLLNAPSPRDVKNRLLSHQKGGAELMLKNLDKRIVVPRTFELWRSVFEFSLMPLSLPSPSNAAILDKWGDQALEELIPARYPNLGVIEAQTQSLKVKHYVRENKEQFFDKDKAKLRITGPGSIFEALFTGSGPSDIQAYLQIADESIATRVNQSDTERLGNVMAAIKTKKRNHLGPDAYVALVRLGFNLPFAHEIDYELLLEAWKRSKHAMPVNRNGSASQVLSRLKKRTTAPFLLHKRSDLREVDLTQLPQLRDSQTNASRGTNRKGGGGVKVPKGRGSRRLGVIRRGDWSDSDSSNGHGSDVGGSSSEEEEQLLPVSAFHDADAAIYGYDQWGGVDYLGPPRRGNIEMDSDPSGEGEVVDASGCLGGNERGNGNSGDDADAPLSAAETDDAAQSQRSVIDLGSSDEDEGDSGSHGKGFMLPDRGGFEAAFDLSVGAVTAGSVVSLQDHQRIVDSQNAPSHVAVVKSNCGVKGSVVNILGKHMWRLKDGVWLNDELVNCFCYLLLVWDMCRCSNDSSRRRSHIFNSYFMWNILDDGSSDEEFGSYRFRSKYAKNAPGGNIFQLHWLFIPICYARHWVVLAANMQKKMMTCINSSGGNNKTYIQHAFRYFEDESLRLKLEQLDEHAAAKSKLLLAAAGKYSNNPTVQQAFIVFTFRYLLCLLILKVSRCSSNFRSSRMNTPQQRASSSPQVNAPFVPGQFEQHGYEGAINPTEPLASGPGPFDFVKEDWTIVYTDDHRFPTPKQSNGDDCGVFVLMAMYYILRGEQWAKRAVVESDVGSFRLYVSLCILNQWIEWSVIWQWAPDGGNLDIDGYVDAENHASAVAGDARESEGEEDSAMACADAQADCTQQRYQAFAQAVEGLFPAIATSSLEETRSIDIRSVIDVKMETVVITLLVINLRAKNKSGDGRCQCPGKRLVLSSRGRPHSRGDGDGGYAQIRRRDRHLDQDQVAMVPDAEALVERSQPRIKGRREGGLDENDKTLIPGFLARP